MKTYNDNQTQTCGGTNTAGASGSGKITVLPRGRQHKRGVATILVISSLLVLTLIGFALITVVTYQKMASGAASTAIAKNENTDISLNKIKDKIQRDLLRSYTGVNANGVTVSNATADLADSYGYNAMTYPDANRKWLSTIEPADDDLNADDELNLNGTVAGLATTDGEPSNDYRRWRQISMVTDADNAIPQNTFVNKSTMQFLTTVTTQSDVDYLPFTTASPDSTDLVADADGDSFADSRWVMLGTPQSDGMVTVMAAKIVDNGGFLNLNTTSNAVGGSDVPLGQTPADTCLFYPLFYADGTAGTWGTAFTATSFVPGANPGTANWTAFYGLKATAAVPATQAARLNYWLAFGSRQNQAFGLYPNTTVFTDRVPMNMQDELELRFLAGKNSTTRSMLENTLDRANMDNPGATNSGPLRSYFAQTHASSTIRNREDRRRLFTTINGTNAVRVPATVTESGTAEFREPMPLWLSEINVGVTPPAAPANTPQGVPFFKLNPNADSPARLGYMFENLLRQNEFIVARYGAGSAMQYPDAINTAYMLAANLARYRLTNAGTPYNVGDTQVYDPTLAQVTSSLGVVNYGVTLQPFMTQICYGETYESLGGDVNKLESTEEPGDVPPTKRLIAIEVRNPWPVPIDLSLFSIRYGGGATNQAIAGSTTLLQPGDYAVISSDDAKWLSSFSATHVPAGKRVLISTAALNVAGGILPCNTTAAGNGTFEIVHTASNVVVDRMRKTDPGWPRPAWTADTSVALDYTVPDQGNFFAGVSTLSRWWTYDHATTPTSTEALGNGYAQSYMLENPAGNFVETLDNSPAYGISLGAWREVDGTAGDYGNDFADILGTAGRLGNTDPTNVATAKAKGGAAPAGVTGIGAWTWPVFQICYPFVNTGTTATTTFGGQITNIAEVLNILTVSHTSTATFGENLLSRYMIVPAVNSPSLGNLPPVLHYGQVPSPGNPTIRNRGWDNAAYNDQLIRTAAPQVPLALTIVAALDTLTSNSNQPFVAGTININTAPAEVMESLPFLYRWDNTSVGRGASYTQWFGTRGIPAYRDLVNLAGMTGSLPGSATSRTASPAGPNFAARPQATTGIDNLRTAEGFVTPSELLMVRSIDAGNNDWFYTMNTLALDGASTPGGVIDSTLDQVIDDSEEDNMVYGKVSNLTTTRSDVFTAWVMLKNQKYNRATSLYETVNTSRYVATILRGVVVASAIDGTLENATTFEILSPGTVLPTGYNGKWLTGKDITLRRRTGTAINSQTETLSARIVDVPSTSPLKLTLKFNQGAYSNAAGQYNGGASLPATNWEYQIVDQPRVLGFTQSK